ncbi:MAG: DNA-binding protein [Geobacter sp.]|nr:DNA-binding protein [Geobacter sp.]
MTLGRFSLICIRAIFLNIFLLGTAFAGFFGSDDKGKSGLDFATGYDINTVSTMSGRVLSSPHSGEKENILVEIKSGNETLNISIGPGPYWEKKGIAINVNDDLTVKGSKAQGQDGKTYVLAQKLVNKTSGAQVDLRNEKGDPVWTVRNSGNMRMESPAGGMRNQGGGMMRIGGGGMMRR